MSNTKFNIDGLKQHIDALKTLPVKMQASIIRGVLRDAGRTQVINKATESLPYGSRRTIKSVMKTESGKNKTSVFVGINQDEFIARFFEYGTQKRQTKKGYNRGRITAKPTIEYSIDSKVGSVVDYINAEFGNRMEIHLSRKIKGAKRKNTKLGL